MPVNVVDNTPTIILETKQKAGLWLRLMIDDIDRISIPYTPRHYGDLRNRKRKQVLGLQASIAWLVNYAIFQELKQYKNYSTAGTGPHFAENSVKKVAANSMFYAKKAGLI